MSTKSFLSRFLDSYAVSWCLAAMGSVLPVKRLQYEAAHFVVDKGHAQWLHFLMQKPNFKTVQMHDFLGAQIFSDYTFTSGLPSVKCEALNTFVRNGGQMHFNRHLEDTLSNDPRLYFLTKLLGPSTDSSLTMIEWLAQRNAVADHLKFAAVMSVLDGAGLHTDCCKIAERLFLRWSSSFRDLEHSSYDTVYWRWMCPLASNRLLCRAIENSSKNILDKHIALIGDRKNISADIIEAVVNKGISCNRFLWKIAQNNGFSSSEDSSDLRGFVISVAPSVHEAVIEYDQRIENQNLKHKLQQEIDAPYVGTSPVPTVRRKM